MRADNGRRPRRAGAVLVELAIILPVLVFVTLICVDFGRFAYHYIAVHNAARAGAQYGITTSYTDAGGAQNWTGGVSAAALKEMEGQTNFVATRLTTTATAGTDTAGLKMVTVEAKYTGFSTLVSWPGIPAAPTLQATVTLPSIR